MSEEAELQAEEKEVLASIYEGDDCFKEISPTSYQYKYGETESKSFLLEITWGPKYPNEKPICNMDIFYNRNLLQSVKDKILKVIDVEAEQWIGCAMTYTLFECLKDKVTEMLEAQEEEVIQLAEKVEKVAVDDDEDAAKKPEKKEQLTKSQKRRAWDRAEVGKGGERPRGYDWVDIVKHLSQVPYVQPTPAT